MRSRMKTSIASKAYGLYVQGAMYILGTLNKGQKILFQNGGEYEAVNAPTKDEFKGFHGGTLKRISPRDVDIKRFRSKRRKLMRLTCPSLT